jgi:glucosamine--fructose-6-phosphate aminotransferase (isomerizing)
MARYNTLEEIERQPATWKKTVEVVEKARQNLLQFFNKVDPEEVLFIGCGTSYYISIAAALTFMEVTGISAKAVPASEIFLKPKAVIPKNKRVLVIGSSRSGATTEVVRALEYVKRNQLAVTLSVTAYPESDMVKQSTYSIKLPHVQERSVVMTSSFTNILLALYYVAGVVGKDEQFIRELGSLYAVGEEVMEHAHLIGKQVGRKLGYEHFIFLGLGAYYGLACEGTLKLKEMTQVFCEAFNPLEFRHGPISVLNEKCAVILLNQSVMADYEVSVVDDVRKFGASTVVLGESLQGFKNDLDVEVKEGFSDKSRGILYLPYLQLIAYYRTLELGLNPDQPRNLTQVVEL